MRTNNIQVGDQLTFQWRPGYRGPLRDGETVIVLAVEADGILVRYRLKEETVLPPDQVYKSRPPR
jgi:hypothetical protein